MNRPAARRPLGPGFYRGAKWVCLIAAAALVVVFATIGYNGSPRSYAGMAIAFLPLAGYVLLRRRQLQAETRLRAHRTWGRPGSAVERPTSGEVRPHRKDYLEWTAHEGEHEVDDRTWSDLGMDEVCADMDVCFTDAGRNELYRLLHHCLVSEEEVSARTQIVDAMLGSESTRDRILMELAAVGRERDADPAVMLWNDSLRRFRLAPLFKGMAVAAVASILSLLLVPPSTALLLIAAVFITNMWLYYSKARDISSLIPSLRVLSRLLQAAANIAAYEPSLAGLDTQELRRQTHFVSSLRRPFRRLLTGSPGAASVSGDIAEMLSLYLKIFFVVDLIAFDRIASVLARDQASVRALYRTVGRIDALHALASYRVYRQDQCSPQPASGSGLEAEGLYHPGLRNKAVRNSPSIARPGAVVTGTNMAGKSTFLRTLGINAVLAQTTGACFARSYRGDRFLVMSSIEKRDDLGSGKSFYYDEAERIFRMIEQVDGSTPVLLLIDELLSGTNSLERESASVAIMHYLARRNALTVAATHDVTIATRLRALYPCFYFTDNATETGLQFDYKLRPGIVQSRNAIKLLSIIGYPDDVIQEALRGAESESGTGPLP